MMTAGSFSASRRVRRRRAGRAASGAPQVPVRTPGGTIRAPRVSASTNCGSSRVTACSSSCGLHQALASTGTAPRDTIAQKLITHSGLLNPRMKTRSPAPMPWPASSVAFAAAA